MKKDEQEQPPWKFITLHLINLPLLAHYVAALLITLVSNNALGLLSNDVDIRIL